MAKVTKKKNRKLRKQIRKTVGALLMVSAITVAAIPVQDVRGANGDAATTTANQKIKVLNYTSPAMTDYEKISDYNKTNADLSSIESDLRSGVPYVDPNATIYTTGDGRFQFAFVKPSATARDEVAVILGANVAGLPGNSLTIPATVDAYKKYTANTTADGYCAVNRAGEYLYYKTSVQKTDPTSQLPLYYVPGLSGEDEDPGEITSYKTGMHKTSQNEDGTWNYSYRLQTGTDDDGNPTYTEYEALPIMIDACMPCYYNLRDNWIEKPDNQLYYWNSTDAVDTTKTDKFSAATSLDKQRIYEAEVQYIGRQYLVANTNNTGGNTQTGQGTSEWKIGGLVTESNPSQGVFAGKGQIAYLTIETIETKDGPKGNLLGIGDYAFYSCSGLQGVTLENGLKTIGNGAFQDCTNMKTCTMQMYSEITAIGKRAFSHCEQLSTIALPVNVRAIGDYCFEGCYNAGLDTGLQTIDINGGGTESALLQAIGYKAFTGCTKLISVTLPAGYTDFETGTETETGSTTTRTVTGIPITYFEGCTSLQYIKAQNTVFTFIESNHNSALNCDIGNFLKNTVSSSFYFEGPKTSAIHTTAKLHSAAFKYVEKDEDGNEVNRYEKVVWCPETEYDEDGNIKDGTGHECTFTVNDNNELIAMEIPDDCGVVEIPADLGAGHGISTIGSTGFQGNLNLIKITIPSTVTKIEENAFAGCRNLQAVVFSEPINITEIGKDAFKTRSTSLSFTGTISPSSEPFKYAMNWENNINASNQPLSYITFYSSWPTYLTVQYTPDDVNHPEVGENELIDYPTYEKIKHYTAWTKNASTGADPDATPDPYAVTYPDMTVERAKAAGADAIDMYEAGTATTDQQQTVNAAVNINLPEGITSIKEGIFSEIKTDASGNLRVDDDGNILLGDDGSPEYEHRNSNIKTITLNSVKEIDPYTFAGCENLSGVYMAGGEQIGNYAFKDCEKLENVEIASSVSELGLRPFAGCSELKNVNFMGSPYYSCENAIIFGLSNGVKDSIVECLEARSSNGVGSYTVGPEELEGITSIEQEAFMDCGYIGHVDLSSTTVTSIPEKCFKNDDDLNRVTLPDTVKTIRSEAFRNNEKLRLVTIPGNQTNIAEDAFMTGDWIENPIDREKDPGTTASKVQQTIEFECVKGTTADEYANYYWYINPNYDKVFLQHTVTFWDYPNYPDTSEQTVYYKVKVIDGEDAVPPTDPPTHDGVVFSRWTNYQNVSKDIDVYPVFGDDVYTVQFLDDDGTPLTDVQYIESGKSATPPADPTKEGATFTGWSNPYFNITKDTLCIAQYDYGADTNLHTVTFYSYDGTTIIAEMKVLNGGTVYPPSAPSRSGYTFVGWVPAGSFTNITSDKSFTASYDRSGSGSSSGSGSGSDGNGSGSNASPSPSATPNPEDSVKKYTVSVSGGSGSGSYAAGEIVAINAYDMGEGQNFDKWTSSTAGVGFANPNATSTTFTMPAANVAITATYKTGSGSSSSGSTDSGSGSGSAAYNSGTIVDVDRSGISNTNLAGATVSGSTDNFIVKVTEDQSATDAVIAALQAKYGDISRIKYLPMDISLYDSTGRIKIADTSGITVNLTLPLPDDLVQYAGNNRVAAVSNGALEELNARFTTVDGVPCVNFTATHFSPYVIYVDTANLTEATIDATPKTGDPIHPKWFLALGLACISLILFFKRDKVVINTKTA